MKRTLISILCILTIISASGQQNLTEEVIEAQSLVNIGLDEVNKVYTPAVNFQNYLKSGTSDNANIEVTYVNFPEKAKVAFEYAVSIWEKCITSPMQINLHAHWEKLSANELGHGKPALFYRNFKDAPLNNVYYPVALVEEITGKEYNSADEADIICSFNNLKPWYFGTDGKTPDTEYDFVTAVLHELGHGLGIAGFFTSEDGVSSYTNSSNTPSVYDFYVFNTNQQRIADKSIFPIPSAALTNQLTSNSLIFSYSIAKEESSEASVYAPATWESGLSIYHLQKTNSSLNAPNELMNAFAYKGEAIHSPGAHTLYVLSELGWKVNPMVLEQLEKSANKNEIAENQNLNVYPNPFSGTLTFNCENINSQSSIEIRITDLMGSTVYSETKYDAEINPQVRVDLSTIKPGIYMASLTDSNLKTITKRIIKN
jgi:hypothetical protein